jgi:FixJ family two-component response regulator
MHEHEQPAVYVVAETAELAEALAWLVSSANRRVVSFSSLEAFISAYDPAWTGCLLVELFALDEQWTEFAAALARQGVRLPAIVISAPPAASSAASASPLPRMEVLFRPVLDHVLLDRLGEAMRWDAKSRGT